MSATKPVLIGFLPPLGGLPKTEAYFDYHRSLINTGDIVYAYATTLLTAGSNHRAWNFSASAEVVNESFSQVVWAIPCRISPIQFAKDEFPYEQATQFIEQLTIPFTSVTESIQSKIYDYDPELHQHLPPKVVRYLKAIADKSRVVGARGEYSAEVLRKLGIKNVEPIGCPSLYVNGPTLPAGLLQRQPFAAVKDVAVVYSNYQQNAASLMSEALALAAAKQYYYVEQTSGLMPKLLYYPHKLEATDFLEAGRLYGGLASLRSLYNANRLRYFTNVTNWREFLAQMDFAFGARMHGLTPALQAGVPAHFIAHDCRVREMCEFFHLPFSAEADLAKTGLNVETLYDQTDYSETVKAYPARYRKFMEFLAANQIQANCNEQLEILEPVNCQPTPGVEVEKNPTTDAPYNQEFGNIMFDIGEAIIERRSVGDLAAPVKTCGNLWQQERDRHTPSKAAAVRLFQMT